MADEVIALALKKCNLDIGDAMLMITVDETVADLMNELT